MNAADAGGGWRVFDAATPILVNEYSFGPGTSNAVAVGGASGLVVISPPWRAGEATFAALERFGTVAALVAPNAFHTLGLAEWKARFPAAPVYAPAQSIARLERRTGIGGIRPLAEAAPLLGAHLRCADIPHYKTGEALVQVQTTRGRVWYVTDVIFNMPKLPDHPIAALVFRLGRTAPGLRFNHIAAVFMMKDKRAVRRWLAEEYRAHPPAWLIPAHGTVVDFTAQPDLARAMREAVGVE